MSSASKITIFSLLVSLSLVSGQGTPAVAGAITSPPSQCSKECSSFSLSSCAVKQAPTSASQWPSTCDSMAACICPILAAREDCHTCLIMKPETVVASTYWGTLQTFCQQGTAGPQICQLFNVSTSANIAGATNVTAPSTAGTVTSPDAPPSETSSKSGDEKMASIKGTAALTIALIASVLL